MAMDPSIPERLLREPLLHFLILGGLIFWLLTDANGPATTVAEDRIVISGSEVDRMALAWAQRWQRPPSDVELAGLISEAVREQVLYREALALGLDRDDVVVRRHLRQKYEFLTQDLAYETNPDDATLRAYYEAESGRYQQPTRMSFRHILFNPTRRGASTEADATQVLSNLQTAKGAQATETLGDATSLPSDYEDIDARGVEVIFGAEFAAALLDLAPGRWAGPITSGYGLHLVLLTEKTPGMRRPFDEVRQQVRDDWVYRQRIAANDAVYRKLLQRYDVVIERPTAPPASAGSGS